MIRAELRRQGEVMRDRLRGGGPDLPPGFGTLLTEAVFGGIWSRPGLELPDRMVSTLAALAVFPRLRALRRLIGAALDVGLEPAAIREVLVQAALYAGFSAAEETLELAAEVFAARGVVFPDDPPAEVSLEALDEHGRATMAALHGDRALQGYAAPDNPVTGALYPLAIQYRLWRYLVAAGAGPEGARPGVGRGVHRAAPAGTGREVRAVGAECGADESAGD